MYFYSRLGLSYLFASVGSVAKVSHRRMIETIDLKDFHTMKIDQACKKRIEKNPPQGILHYTADLSALALIRIDGLAPLDITLSPREINTTVIMRQMPGLSN